MSIIILHKKYFIMTLLYFLLSLIFYLLSYINSISLGRLLKCPVKLDLAFSYASVYFTTTKT